MLKSLLANQPYLAEKDFAIDAGNVKWGHEVQIGYFPQDTTGVIEHGITIVDWLTSVRSAGHHRRHPRHPRPDALPR